jgi:hypothetical protein
LCCCSELGLLSSRNSQHAVGLSSVSSHPPCSAWCPVRDEAAVTATSPAACESGGAAAWSYASDWCHGALATTAVFTSPALSGGLGAAAWSCASACWCGTLATTAIFPCVAREPAVLLVISARVPCGLSGGEWERYLHLHSTVLWSAVSLITVSCSPSSRYNCGQGPAYQFSSCTCWETLSRMLESSLHAVYAHCGTFQETTVWISSYQICV